MPREKKTYSLEMGGKELTLEVSELAGQTNAAVLGRYGETVVLATVVMGEKDQAIDYMPLKVDYEERFYASGKIIGSRFIRREGRPSEDAILSGRLVDRTIRPLFDHRLRREVQVVVTVLSYDEENDPDFVGLIASSAALAISNVPWGGPVGGIRVVREGREFLINPNNSRYYGKEYTFETFVAGPKGEINMIELGGLEASETDVLEAFRRAQKEIDRLIAFQEKMVKEVGKPKTNVVLFAVAPELKQEIESFLEGRLKEAMFQKTREAYYEKLSALKKELLAHLEEKFGVVDMRGYLYVFDEMMDALVHKSILENDERPDGRALDEVRPLYAEVGLFHRTHGSGYFVRGNTQALAVTTLAAPGAEQIIETMETTGRRRFLLHYNFPPYSVGETGPFRGPGRREIGHGALAEKAIRRLLPTKEAFPYTIRVVSEILSSNGSSSMATVCASILSLMDAGVPLAKPAAGIAMGLVIDEKKFTFKILTDIQGPEDHYGDMDFKVAGTDAGVNAVQMDTKVTGVTLEVLEKALEEAKRARLHILGYMNSVLPSPRASLSPYAPVIVRLSINPEKIGLVIGPGGKTINGLIEKHGLGGIDIEEDGNVYVSGTDKERVERAVKEIENLTREFKVGEIVEGTIVKTLDFGAIMDLGGGQDGMIHVSELKNGFTKSVGEVVKVGDFVRAKVIRIDPDGRIGLSLKQLQG